MTTQDLFEPFEDELQLRVTPRFPVVVDLPSEEHGKTMTHFYGEVGSTF